MLIGQINFTNMNANSRLQQRQQYVNATFTGTPKLNISKSRLNETVRVGETGGAENNLFKRIKKLFYRVKQVLIGGKTAKSLDLGEPGVPHNLTRIDFASVKGELTYHNSKVIKNEDGQIIRMFFSLDGKNVSSIADIDPKTKNMVKVTKFREGSLNVSAVQEYDCKTRKPVKFTIFNDDGTVKEVYDHDPKTGNQVMHTEFNKDGSIKEIRNF